jgi:leucyl aminopeptidase
MKISVKTGNVESVRTEALVYGMWEGDPPRGFLHRLDKAMDGELKDRLENKEFEGKAEQIAVFYAQRALPAKRVVLVGLGKKGEISIERIRRSMGKAGQKIREMGVEEFTTSVNAMGCGKDLPAAVVAQGLVEGALLGLYRFTKYRVKEKRNSKEVLEMQFVESPSDSPEVRKGAKQGEIISNAVSLARDMVNHPANEMTPTIMAKIAARMAKQTGVRCKVFSKTEVERIGMGAFLGVAQGSEEPPQFIVLEYHGGKKGERPIAIVGKSITFDSGGISIKPSEGMEKMKYDMSGGAATLGVFQAAAQLCIPVNLVGFLPATENLPSGTAIKPGDILRSLSGWTIEVVNTDAEGRLVLADALTYSLKYRPQVIVDMATLTGACVVALGNHAIGMIGNDKDLVKKMIMAGEETGERVWEMPLWEEYHEQIKSPVADIKNTGGRDGGMITAAAFLSKFVEKYPWVHLDIAGVAWKEKDSPYSPKGAAGVGVRLLVQFLLDRVEEKKKKV